MQFPNLNRGVQNAIRELLVKAPIVTAAAWVEINPNPVYGAIWAAATTYLTMSQRDEREAFSDELMKREIPEDVLSSVEFARAAKVTLEAVANTASKEKIQILARLLANGSDVGLINEFDVYKEYARLIDDISPREFQILRTMEHYMEAGGLFGKLPPIYSLDDERKYQHLRDSADELGVNYASISGEKPEEGVSTLEHSWREAMYRIKQKHDFSKAALESMMLRLMRTGCVAPVSFIKLTGKATVIYRVTPLYFSLKQYIEEQNES